MAPTSTSALSADSLLDYMTKSLPSRTSDQHPLLRDSYSSIALFCHACMIAVGFRLVGLGEDHKIEAQSDADNAQPLPTEWDASSTYAFRYKHPQSSMEYLVKVNRLGGKALIFGVALGDDRTVSTEVVAQDYISQGSLQETANTSDTSTSTALRNIFISTGRITDLSSLFRTQIINKLAPGIHKPGYEAESESTTTTTSPSNRTQPDRDTRPTPRDPLRDYDQPQPARPYPFADPLAAPRRPHPAGDFPPPGFDDEYDLNRPLRGGLPGRTPFGNIGERDLYPPGLGPNDPLRMGPSGGYRGGGAGGGMHPTFDDPLFGGQSGVGGGYDLRAPPGARYDPIGPGDGPPNLRGGARFPGGRGGGGSSGGFGAPPNPFGGYGSGDFI